MPVFDTGLNYDDCILKLTGTKYPVVGGYFGRGEILSIESDASGSNFMVSEFLMEGFVKYNVKVTGSDACQILISVVQGSNREKYIIPSIKSMLSI